MLTDEVDAESQRAMVAARLATLKRGANQHREISLPSQEEAAQQLRVDVKTVKAARAVLERGSPELVRAVESGPQEAGR